MAVGTRLQDFTTGSRALIRGGARLIQLNIQAFDAGKHDAMPLVGDARVTLAALGAALGDHTSPADWRARVAELRQAWAAEACRATAPGNGLPTDAQVLGAVNRAAGPEDVVVCAAGGLPGELHKLWRATGPGSYHLEYGFSCMGYEIAGGLGVRMARPDGEVFVMVGDGSYLMMNSELQTSVRMRQKLIVTVLDNHGFGCIDRLQRACGGESFNNLWPDGADWVDFAAHARAWARSATAVDGIAALEAALADARGADRTTVIVIETDPLARPTRGGAWWDVAVPEVSSRPEAGQARAAYEPRWRRGSAEHDGPARHQPDRLEQRRHAGTRRRHAARDMSGRGAAGRVHRDRERQQVPARRRRDQGRARPPRAASSFRAGMARNCGFRDVEAEIAAMRPHLELLQGCGCHVMVFAEVSGTVQGRRDVPVGDRPVMSEAEWPVFLDRLGRLGDWMAAQGVRIAFHHHMGTVIEKAHEIDRLLAGTPDSVGLLFDTGHLRFAGEDPAAAARRWAHRVNHVHAKDVRPEVLARAQASAGAFSMRWSPASSPCPATAASISRRACARSRLRITRLADRRSRAGPGQGASAHLREEGLRPPAERCRTGRFCHRTVTMNTPPDMLNA